MIVRTTLVRYPVASDVGPYLYSSQERILDRNYDYRSRIVDAYVIYILCANSRPIMALTPMISECKLVKRELCFIITSW